MFWLAGLAGNRLCDRCIRSVLYRDLVAILVAALLHERDNFVMQLRRVRKGLNDALVGLAAKSDRGRAKGHYNAFEFEKFSFG